MELNYFSLFYIILIKFPLGMCFVNLLIRNCYICNYYIRFKFIFENTLRHLRSHDTYFWSLLVELFLQPFKNWDLIRHTLLLYLVQFYQFLVSEKLLDLEFCKYIILVETWKQTHLLIGETRNYKTALEFPLQTS